MAAPLTEGAKRYDAFRINPYDVLVDNAQRGRLFEPDHDRIVAMAENIYAIGQVAPVEVRKVDGQLHLVLGYTRTAAARWIRTGDPENNIPPLDPEFMLKCVVFQGNDEEAFIRNVSENAVRNATSPIEDAVMQAKARDRYGMDNDAIAKLYACSVSKVDKLEALLPLDADERKMVHYGHLSVDAALALMELPKAERRKVLEEANGGKVTAAQVKAKLRAKHLADIDSEKDGAEAGDGIGKITTKTKKLTRTYAETKQFLANLDPDNAEDTDVRKFLRLLNEWIDGKVDDDKVRQAMNKLAGRARPTKPVEVKAVA